MYRAQSTTCVACDDFVDGAGVQVRANGALCRSCSALLPADDGVWAVRAHHETLGVGVQRFVEKRGLRGLTRENGSPSWQQRKAARKDIKWGVLLGGAALATIAFGGGEVIYDLVMLGAGTWMTTVAARRARAARSVIDLYRGGLLWREGGRVTVLAWRHVSSIEKLPDDAETSDQSVQPVYVIRDIARGSYELWDSTEGAHALAAYIRHRLAART